MVRNIKLIIAYDGTNYYGWQKQKNKKTIQGEIEQAIYKILNHPIKLIGASRTDAHAHAIAQVANFITTSKIPLDNLKKALNSILTKDIVIKKISQVSLDFNARKSATSREYKYCILNSKEYDPFILRTSYYYPYKLNIARMRKAAKMLIGTHDFAAFANNIKENKNTLRNVKKISISKKGSLVTIRIKANSFLTGMIRNIVGTLIKVSEDKVLLEDIKEMLKTGKRKSGIPTLPANALTLIKVEYK
jgi:tRNA pseudouridine38-40 synthase